MHIQRCRGGGGSLKGPGFEHGGPAPCPYVQPRHNLPYKQLKILPVLFPTALDAVFSELRLPTPV